MKETPLTEATREVIELKLKVVDEFIDEVVEPLQELGSPEKLIGKEYEQWTPTDLQILGQLYGPEPNALSRLIFKKEYAKLQELEGK